jgi:hypothetical protein
LASRRPAKRVLLAPEQYGEQHELPDQARL